MKKNRLALGLITLVAMLALCSCTQKQNDVSRAFNFDDKYNNEKVVSIDHGTLDETGDIRVWIYATSETSYEQNHNDENLILRNTQEPVYLSVHQIGKDRRVRILAYLDYESRAFSIGTDGEKAAFYDIEIKNNEEVVLPVYFDFSNIDTEKSHRMAFIIISGYDQYAKDKEDITYNPAISTMYQLFFKNYEADARCADEEKKNMAEKMEYYDSSGIALLLNTSEGGSSLDEGLPLPDKHYLMDPGNEMKMHCWISNTSTPEKYALVFVTVGNLPARINGENYLIVDLNERKMGEKEIELILPEKPGVYDIIGYVVYDPFEPIENGESGFVYSSPRFSVEVKENDRPD